MSFLHCSTQWQYTWLDNDREKRYLPLLQRESAVENNLQKPLGETGNFLGTFIGFNSLLDCLESHYYSDPKSGYLFCGSWGLMKLIKIGGKFFF